MENQSEQNPILTAPTETLSITEVAAKHLLETGKWTKFLAILGFIFIGFILILAVFAGSLMTFFSMGSDTGLPGFMGVLMGGMYILMGLLYFFPTLYLYRFSKKLQLAVATQNNQALNDAFGNQKSFYKFWGIFTIVVLGIYLILGMFSGLGSALFM